MLIPNSRGLASKIFLASKILTMRVLYCRFFGLVLLVAPCVQASSAPQPPGHGPYPDEQKILDLLNQAREKANLPRLEWDPNLAEAARAHSALMAASQEIGHQFPGEAGVPERMAASRARFTASAENVAVADTAEEIHMALMHSPGHRANIMSPHYNSVGIGVVQRKGRLYVTQDFAWLMPVYSEAQFYDALVQAFNRARKSRGIRALNTGPDSRLHSAVCSTDGDISSVAVNVSGNARMVLFTASDPGKVPEKLTDYISSPRLERMNVGVCFRPDPQYGSANFWVAVVFYE